jgi:hypothetical protein
MERIWKTLEMWAREALECCKQNLMGNSGGSSEDRMPIRMQTEKTVS